MNEIEEFKNFLIKHNALDQYIKNVDTKRVKRFVNYGISFYYIIDASFVWKRTPEGENYWRTIQELWQQQYDDKNDIDYSDIVEKIIILMNYGRINMKEFEQFRLFLVENNVLDRYIKYADMEKEKSKYTFSRYIRQLIDWAFKWTDTEEGQTFWEELDKKWRAKCAAENISCICTIKSVVDYLRNNIELWED